MKKIAVSILISFALLFIPEAQAQIVSNPAAPGCSMKPRVKVENGRLKVLNVRCSYEDFIMKGVGYGPEPIGGNTEWGYPDPNDPRPDNIFDDPQILNRDFVLLEAMNANTIRIWGGDNIQNGAQFPLKITQQTLNLAEHYGIKVIAGFRMPWPGAYSCQGGQSQYTLYTDFTDPNERQDLKSRFRTYVQQWKNHPAILF